MSVSWMERNALALVVVAAACVLACAKLFLPGAWAWKEFVRAVIVDMPIQFKTPPTQVPTLLVITCAVAAIALVLAALSHRTNRRLLPLLILASASTVVGLIVSEPLLRIGLMELGAFLTVALVWQSAKSNAAKYTYLVVVVLSALSLAASDHVGGSWSWALLLTSICIKLAAIPLCFWLLSLADEVPALVLGLIIAVVDMAAFGEFFISSWCLPDHADFLPPSAILLGVAAATSFLAALLMLSQRSLKRLLVLSTIEDIGFLLLGVFSLKTLGYDGAIFAAATHSLAKALLFICLSGPEADGALEGEPKGLAARYPVAAFGFLFGMLAMLGIPPTMGFLGRWRLYETALQIGPCPLTIFILSSIFALIAYVLALTRFWWGPQSDADSPPNPPFPEF
jgi:formate hydrogenlyase subunit 3/multisubunit Na+/H+ antiporter MnhD subunit